MTTYNLSDIEADDYDELKRFSRLLKYSDKELIDAFNHEVGNNGWTSSRAEFLVGLHKEFDKRGIDYSEIGEIKSLSFKHKIKLVNNIITKK